MEGIKNPDFIPYLGLSEKDESLISFLKNFGKKNQLTKNQGEFKASIVHPPLGLDFIFTDGRTVHGQDDSLLGDYLLTAVNLYSEEEGDEEYRGYRNKLPHGLYFSDSRSDVHAKLGKPKKSGGGGKVNGKALPFWDRYQFENHSVHIKYDGSARQINLITLLTNLGTNL